MSSAQAIDAVTASGTQVTLNDIFRTGPGTIAGRYLRRFWHPIMRARDLAKGQSRTVRIMSEDVTLYRGESGELHAVQAYCPHRATLLSTGWVEGETIRCRYHGWRFGPDGSCVEVPAGDEVARRAAHVHVYPVQEYLQLIFIYMGDGQAPPMKRYPDFERPGFLEASKLIEDWPCNFFNRVDNASDIMHVQFTHREAIRRSNGFQWRGQMATNTSQETDYGVCSTEVRPGRPISYAHFHMPNVNQVRARGVIKASATEPAKPILGDRLFWRVPVDDNRSISLSVLHYAITPEESARYLETQPEREALDVEWLRKTAQAVVDGNERLENLKEELSTYQLFWMEDYIVQVGQQSPWEGRAELLGKSDVGVSMIRRIWRREMQALVDGKPLKDWVTPAGLAGGEE